MYRKLKAESVPLTLELATRFRNMTPLPGERCQRNTRRAFLASHLMHNSFDGPDWAEGYCKADGITYRLDGQHSSELLTNLPAGVSFPEGLIATVTRYEFDSLADAPVVFDLFNNPRSARNNQDKMGTYAAGVEGLRDKGYSREFLIDVANGLHEYETQRKRKGAKDAVLFGPRDRGLYYTIVTRPDFITAAHWLGEFRDKKNASFLDKPVIVAEMLMNLAANPVLADDFWKYIFSENHPDPDHETRVLAELYRELLATAKKPKLDMTIFRKKAVRAWKSFKTTETVAA